MGRSSALARHRQQIGVVVTEGVVRVAETRHRGLDLFF
jgi:hypothetical protein